MTSYHGDNLPDEMLVEPIPDELFDGALAALTQALGSGQVIAKQAIAAYVYNRRGYMGFDSFAYKPDNTTNDKDDVIIQLTVRMNNPRMFDGELSETKDLEENVAAHSANAKRNRLKAEIAAQEVAVKNALAIAAEAQKRLDEMTRELPSK